MKKLNKKGFTLVELLAVIVVLALLMVVATTSIGSSLNTAKKKALQSEAQKLLNSNFSNEQAKYIENSVYTAPAASVQTEGDFKYKITFNSSAQITSYCFSYPKAKLSINVNSITATDSVPVVGAIDTTFTDCA